MTTTVEIRANHGWPVDITEIYADGTRKKRRVPAGTTEEVAVWDTKDVLIHEVQPSEIATDW